MRLRTFFANEWVTGPFLDPKLFDRTSLDLQGPLLKVSPAPELAPPKDQEKTIMSAVAGGFQ
jgi:hypothetical protein